MIHALRLFGLAIIPFFLLTACGEQTAARRALKSIGSQKLRAESIHLWQDTFPQAGVQKIPEERWPETVRALGPLSAWAEPDGVYLLIDSDADGERGIYLPRIVSEKDPLCSPVLRHAKLAEGVYWYERKR